MAFNQSTVGKWGIPIAGTAPASSFGQLDAGQFGGFINSWRQVSKDMSPEEKQMFMPVFLQQMSPAEDTTLVRELISESRRANSPEEQRRQLELADEYQTRKGWKSAMFNTLTSGLENLTKGIGMSMNPYGSMENARYIADALASSSDRMATGYAAVRNPLQIPGVNPPGAPAYF
jgi:hypothetical protein